MRIIMATLLLTGAVLASASAQPPASKPRPDGQGDGATTCVSDCAKDLAKCREAGRTDGIPPRCAPDYNACVKRCK